MWCYCDYLCDEYFFYIVQTQQSALQYFHFLKHNLQQMHFSCLWCCGFASPVTDLSMASEEMTCLSFFLIQFHGWVEVYVGHILHYTVDFCQPRSPLLLTAYDIYYAIPLYKRWHRNASLCTSEWWSASAITQNTKIYHPWAQSRCLHCLHVGDLWQTL